MRVRVVSGRPRAHSCAHSVVTQRSLLEHPSHAQSTTALRWARAGLFQVDSALREVGIRKNPPPRPLNRGGVGVESHGVVQSDAVETRTRPGSNN